MKKKESKRYQDISSFADIRTEKERLQLKRRLLELRIEINVSEFRKKLSIAEIIPSVFRDLGLSGIAQALSSIISKAKQQPGND